MAAGDGLVSMTPTSTAHSGTSATINSDGGVDVVSVTSVSLNGVFTSTYTNYRIVVKAIGVGGGVDAGFRLRASGSDASGSNYTRQIYGTNSTSLVSTRNTSITNFDSFNITNTANNGGDIIFYGPQIAAPTAIHVVQVSSVSSAYLLACSGTHSLATSYDGFTLYALGSNSITGNIHVFGFEE